MPWLNPIVIMCLQNDLNSLNIRRKQKPSSANDTYARISGFTFGSSTRDRELYELSIIDMVVKHEMDTIRIV